MIERESKWREMIDNRQTDWLKEDSNLTEAKETANLDLKSFFLCRGTQLPRDKRNRELGGDSFAQTGIEVKVGPTTRAGSTNTGGERKADLQAFRRFTFAYVLFS